MEDCKGTCLCANLFHQFRWSGVPMISCSDGLVEVPNSDGPEFRESRFVFKTRQFLFFFHIFYLGKVEK